MNSLDLLLFRSDFISSGKCSDEMVLHVFFLNVVIFFLFYFKNKLKFGWTKINQLNLFSFFLLVLYSFSIMTNSRTGRLTIMYRRLLHFFLKTLYIAIPH